MKRLLCVMTLAVLVLSGPQARAAGTGQEPVLGDTTHETSVVRIRGYEGVFPRNLFIAPGTVVIWLNQYRGQVRVDFPEKKVTTACHSPVGFKLDDAGHFVADQIEFGAVASLCFIERGSFAYTVERSPDALIARSDRFQFQGQIVVK